MSKQNNIIDDSIPSTSQTNQDDIQDEAILQSLQNTSYNSASSSTKGEDAKTNSKVQTKENTERDQVIDVTLKELEKRFGEGIIMKLGSKKHSNIEVIPTGSLSLDIALGVGGWPKGRIVEIYGPEASGKTTLTLHAIAEAQKKGGRVAFIDAEHALDPSYARKLGVDINELYVSQPDYAEQALEIVEALITSSAFDIIVIDSVAALVPKAEVQGEMGDSHMGLQARLMSQALRKLTPLCARSNTCIMFLNQLRMKIGVMFGNPETTTGGNALKFYASVRIDIRKRDAITKGEEIIGHTREVNIVKNKVAPPFRKVKFDIYFDRGIDKQESTINAALKLGILEKNGTWYKYNEKQLAQGKEKLTAYLIENKDLEIELIQKIREKI